MRRQNPGVRGRMGDGMTDSLAVQLRARHSLLMTTEVEAVALELFVARGFDAVTVEEIASKARNPGLHLLPLLHREGGRPPGPARPTLRGPPHRARGAPGRRGAAALDADRARGGGLGR